MRGRADGFGGHGRSGRAVERKRQLRKVEKCRSPRACVRQHVLDGLLGIVLVHHTVFVMVVRDTVHVHLRMNRLKRACVVEYGRLTGRCEGLAEQREQQDDCEQSAHEMGCRQLRIRRNHSDTARALSQNHISRPVSKPRPNGAQPA